MNYHYLLFGLILFVSLTGCGTKVKSPLEEPIKINLASTSASEKAKQIVQQNWSRILAGCPGIVRYATDISFVGLNDQSNQLDPKDPAWVDVILKVSSDPLSIPKEYRARGNNCYFRIDVDGANASISKTACASLCADRVVNYDELRGNPLTIWAAYNAP